MNAKIVRPRTRERVLMDLSKVNLMSPSAKPVHYVDNINVRDAVSGFLRQFRHYSDNFEDYRMLIFHVIH